MGPSPLSCRHTFLVSKLECCDDHGIAPMRHFKHRVIDVFVEIEQKLNKNYIQNILSSGRFNSSNLMKYTVYVSNYLSPFQIYFYHNVKCRTEMYDRDIMTLQVCDLQS